MVFNTTACIDELLRPVQDSKFVNEYGISQMCDMVNILEISKLTFCQKIEHPKFGWKII